MNDAFMWGVLGFWITTVLADMWICLRALYSTGNTSFFKVWKFAYRPVYILCTFLIALDGVLERNWFATVIYTFYGSVMAWMWWNDEDNKRRRRKLKDKLAERVRDLGGKLTVVRPSEG